MIPRWIIQTVAMSSMLVDHIGLIFFPDMPTLRAIGRLAFPAYCLCIVQGLSFTRDRRTYLWRLFLLGCTSQFPYWLAFGKARGNAIFTLLCVAWFLILIENRHLWSPALRQYCFYMVMVFVLCGFCTYGQYALALGLVMTACNATMQSNSRTKSVPRIVWLAFYPTHLLGLTLARKLLE